MGFIIVAFYIIAALSLIIGVVKACAGVGDIRKLYLPVSLSFILGLTSYLASEQAALLQATQDKLVVATEQVNSARQEVSTYLLAAKKAEQETAQVTAQFESYKAVAEDTIASADKRNADLEANLKATQGALKEASEKLVKIQKVIEAKGK